MQSSVENDLAEAKRRWTEKNFAGRVVYVARSSVSSG